MHLVLRKQKLLVWLYGWQLLHWGISHFVCGGSNFTLHWRNDNLVDTIIIALWRYIKHGTLSMPCFLILLTIYPWYSIPFLMFSYCFRRLERWEISIILTYMSTCFVKSNTVTRKSAASSKASSAFE